MEPREPQKMAPFRLSPDIPSDGPFAGYKGLNGIYSAAVRNKEMRFCNLMHHFNYENLLQAFRKLDGSKASGIDRVTKQQYEKKLRANLIALECKIRAGGWRPRPSREVLIPKSQGGWRPLAIGCLEDKIVQTVMAKILDALYEPLFDERSYGFRYKKSAHQAIARLYGLISSKAGRCTVVEMDIEKFFNSMSHSKLMRMIEKRVGDSHFLRLIRRSLRNSILTSDGTLQVSEKGSPQGSPVSPVLANIYLHHILDLWFMEKWGADAGMVRYADDAVFVFSDRAKADQFKRDLEEQLVTEGELRLNMEKSQAVRFSSLYAKGDVPFLGFTYYWGRTVTQTKVLKVKTNPKKLGKSIQEFTDWIKKERNRKKLDVLWKTAAAKLRGHYNYYGVSFNQSKLRHFYQACIRALFKWLNRRSQKRSFTWIRFKKRLLFNPLPRPLLGKDLKDISLGILSE